MKHAQIIDIHLNVNLSSSLVLKILKFSLLNIKAVVWLFRMFFFTHFLYMHTVTY